ncbi:hypothetical protein GCM10020331_052040 [Ectobacillus funiculus]
MDAATKEVESKLKDVNISTDGLQIYMTLDPNAQQYADKIMATQDIVSYPNDRFQAAFTFMDSKKRVKYVPLEVVVMNTKQHSWEIIWQLI